jgi:hypothetical protein
MSEQISEYQLRYESFPQTIANNLAILLRGYFDGIPRIDSPKFKTKLALM